MAEKCICFNISMRYVNYLGCIKKPQAARPLCGSLACGYGWMCRYAAFFTNTLPY